MRALLIDDQQLIRESLEMLLQSCCPTSASTTRQRHVRSSWRDDRLPADPARLVVGRGQRRAMHRAARAAGSTAPVIVVSGDDNEQVVQQALALGAAGYVTKSGSKNSLLDAIRVTLGGGRYCAPARGGPAAPIPGVPVRRELQEVFPDLTNARSKSSACSSRAQDKQIARELNIAEAP